MESRTDILFSTSDHHMLGCQSSLMTEFTDSGMRMGALRKGSNQMIIAKGRADSRNRTLISGKHTFVQNENL